MNWNFLAVGRREEVKDHIRGLPRVPEGVRVLIFAALDAAPANTQVR